LTTANAGISEEDKLAIIAGQHATPVDIFRQLSTKGTKDEAPGSELHEQEASVDEDELLHGQPPFRIVPYGDTPTGKGEATHQTLLGPQVSHGGGLASPVSLEAMLERQTYNQSIYSPSMGITQHGAPRVSSPVSLKAFFFPSPPPCPGPCLQSHIHPCNNYGKHKHPPSRAPSRANTHRRRHAEHERMREENAGPADMVAATGIVPFALAAPLHTRLETGLVNTCALGLEGECGARVSVARG
jgi:hypothetical protein